MSVLLALAHSVALSFGTAADSIAWEPQREAALARARAERRVVFVAVNMDGERACDRLAEKVYRDKTIVALASATVNLIASQPSHTAGDKACARFGTIPCTAHQTVDKWVRKEVLVPDAEGYVVAPQHVFLDSKGAVILSVPYDVTPDAGLVEPFKKLSLRLKVGELGAVRTQFGMHVIKRVE